MLEFRSPNGRDRLGYAVCGLGPAGCGFLLHAIKDGAIDHLVDQGLVLIDRSATPGAGKVGRYQLTGNSLSRAFLDCIDDPKLDWFFGDLREQAPSVMQLRSKEFFAPPLDVVGEFLTLMMERTLSYLVREYDVPLLLETSVETMQRQVDGHFVLSLRDHNGGAASSLHVDHVLCGFGGRQGADVLQACEVLPDVRLGQHARQLLPSDDFLMMPDEQVRETIRPLGADGFGDVVVVGGSHSAMSTIDRLTEALAPVGLRRIIMLQRSPLRLYYASAEEAERDGYGFDPAGDICPMSQRVNRFGGLRYRSFDVARSILETGKTPDQSIEVVSVRLDEETPERVAAYLEEAAAVIACLGYQANLPPLVNHWNQEIPLRNLPRGLEIDPDGRALSAEGEPIPGLYVYGIGSRLLTRSDAIGGEPSFDGSADGVWLYHNHGGAVILDALKKTYPEQPNQMNQIIGSANHVRVASSR